MLKYGDGKKKECSKACKHPKNAKKTSNNRSIGRFLSVHKLPPSNLLKYAGWRPDHPKSCGKQSFATPF